MAKWDKTGIPHKGWQCIDIIDLKDDNDSEEVAYEQCEMCGNEKIRFVHIMEHPEYPETLRVGCICDEKMSEDYENPRVRENRLKNKATRRRNFNNMQWKFNPFKNTYSKKYKGQYITIVKGKRGNFGIYFDNKIIWNYNKKQIQTFEFAEKVAFEIFDEFHTTKRERAIISLY